MRNSFVFYRSFSEAIKYLSKEDQLQAFWNIVNYAMDEELPSGEGLPMAIFNMAKPQIDKNNIRYQNGCKGGRPKNQAETKPKPKQKQTETKTEPSRNQTETKQKPNDNVNDNVNDYIKHIVEFLNKKCHTHYKPSTAKTRTLINARMKEGFTVQDFETVIRKKADEWMGTEQERYLRPETLFGTKFESYLNQNVLNRPRNSLNNFNQRDNDYDAIQAALIRKSMNEE